MWFTLYLLEITLFFTIALVTGFDIMSDAEVWRATQGDCIKKE